MNSRLRWIPLCSSFRIELGMHLSSFRLKPISRSWKKLSKMDPKNAIASAFYDTVKKNSQWFKFMTWNWNRLLSKGQYCRDPFNSLIVFFKFIHHVKSKFETPSINVVHLSIWLRMLYLKIVSRFQISIEESLDTEIVKCITK